MGNDTVPCIQEIDGFASCFLFSLETQHTIGYGSRQTTTECVSAMIAMSMQSILGCLIQAFMVGLVFAKLSRPKSRSKTVVFSKQAVICERNRKLCMVFRIGDMRHDSMWFDLFNLNLNFNCLALSLEISGLFFLFKCTNISVSWILCFWSILLLFIRQLFTLEVIMQKDDLGITKYTTYFFLQSYWKLVF